MMNLNAPPTNGLPHEPAAAAASSRVRLDELLDHLLADESRMLPNATTAVDARSGEASEESSPPPSSSGSGTNPVRRSGSDDDPIVTDARARRIDAFASRVHDIFLGESNEGVAMSASDHREMKEAFEQWQVKRREVEERREFESIEAFVLEEQRRTLQQRKEARRVQSLEEVKMAAGRCYC